MNSRGRGLTRATAVALAALAIVIGRGVMAQDLTPRAYVIAPVGSTAAITQFTYLQGGVTLNGALPITGASATIELPSLAFYRTFALLGRTASVTLGVPYGIGQFSGTIVEVPRHLDRSGFLDSSLRFSVNLLGGPAMRPREFARWRQRVLLGASLRIIPPTGQYDPTRLINYGQNRWAFKPELGYSQRWADHWLVDVYAGGWFFTTNPEYYSHNVFFPGTRTQSEAPVASFEAHLSYNLAARAWVSLDANYWSGGSTGINGVVNPATDQKNSRVGLTASIPLTRHQSVKLAVSDGAYIRYGGNYKSIAVAWQYAWIGE